MKSNITQDFNDFLIPEPSTTSESTISNALIAEIYAYRKVLNVSQVTLAEQSSVIQSIISRMENGVTVPKLQTLLRLTEALNLDVQLIVTPRTPLNEDGRSKVYQLKDRKSKQLKELILEESHD
ncbi:helix-turn-helix domain-containing protein [Lysinibacillus sp. UGB7]|uniref:helix-turn-helix domain-containing protein n=1 Tax=Lysinibacillus sp. UGB7 TaxID=3411039 RepID=UPI003B8277FF